MRIRVSKILCRQGSTRLKRHLFCILKACGDGRIGNYDYDCVYLKNGIGYHVFPSTKSQELTFGLAWINECTDDNNVQTWYGADPTIM